MKSGTFTFVADGIVSALDQAKAAAGGKDIIVMGANAAQQYLKAGLADEIVLQLAPVLLGAGTRLFDHLGAEHIELTRTRLIGSPFVTHLKFDVANKQRARREIRLAVSRPCRCAAARTMSPKRSAAACRRRPRHMAREARRQHLLLLGDRPLQDVGLALLVPLLGREAVADRRVEILRLHQPQRLLVAEIVAGPLEADVGDRSRSTAPRPMTSMPRTQRRQWPSMSLSMIRLSRQKPSSEACMPADS